MSEAAFNQRATGAILGSAVGDALGAPFEFGPPNRYSERFPSPVVGGIGEMIGGGGFGWGPGEFTDDTQMAIIQAESILANGGIDGADLFERFRVWAADANDVGIQTRSDLGSGFAWDVAATRHFANNPGSGADNGSLVRSTPTAVYFARSSVEETVAAARTTSAVTHGDPAAGWGTALYHLMIRSALAGDDPFVALDEGLAMLPEDQGRFQRMLAADWAPTSPVVPNGTVWGCLATAVWAVRNNDTFSGAVIAEIDVGGDTIAAVTGGLAGAIHGVQAIPSRWLTYLHGHVTTADGPQIYRSVDLQELTQRLLGRSPYKMAELGSPVGPTEIAPGLYAADLAAASTVPTDWAVVSMCRVEDRFRHHPIRREVYLIDSTGDANPGLEFVVDDLVATVDAFLADGRNVVVHCHHGQSRTGLALRAWLMRTNGWDEPTATGHVAELWPSLRLHNTTFTRMLHAWE